MYWDMDWDPFKIFKESSCGNIFEIKESGMLPMKNQFRPLFTNSTSIRGTHLSNIDNLHKYLHHNIDNNLSHPKFHPDDKHY